MVRHLHRGVHAPVSTPLSSDAIGGLRSEVMASVDQLELSIGTQEVLRGLTLAVRAEEILAIVGPSGSGKSSVLHCMAGLLRPTSGSVRFRGQELTDLDTSARARIRRESMGFVFQTAELVPELTLRQNVRLPLDLVGGRAERSRADVTALLEALGLAERADARPGQVSGGEAQRAAVARAVVHRPAVVFADEPTGALDTENGRVVLDLLLRLAREEGAAVVMVTHDEDVARRADRVVTLRDGRVVSDRPQTALAR